jgi:membrane-associated phospholipid phosphatase
LVLWTITAAWGLALLAGSPSRAQEASSAGAESSGAVARDSDPGTLTRSADDSKQAIKRFAGDQYDLWTSPARVRSRDAKWLLLLGGTAAGLLVADHNIMQHNTFSPANVMRSVDFSNYGVGAMVGAGAGLYLWGHLTGDDHKQETGILSGESALNALVVATGLGYLFGRERPNVDNAQGSFFRGGKSFPSDHSAVAWSIASMVAHGYPGRLTKLFSYGLASAVSLSRVTGNQHFPSDVFVGGAMGWLIAREMYHQHHDENLGGEAWGGPSVNDHGQMSQTPRNLASPYVPLDSWIYPDLDRLATLGYIHTEFIGMRPWTRTECARLVQEAGENLQQTETDTSHVSRIYDALAREFSPELNAGGEPSHNLRLESVYTRVLGISGQPLNDSYHFGETIFNDFGRPYRQGFDPVSGFSGWANWGRFAVYVRGEYQHSPSAPAYSQTVRHLIAQTDNTPVQPAIPFSTINQFTLLDAYALTKLGNWDFSFGKESLWWGPNQGGSLLLSDNAQPFYMFRVARDIPFGLPGIFEKLGPIKVDAFMGKLADNQYPPRPLFHGEKFSLKPTQNLEISFSRTGEFGGVGRALTLGAIFNTYFALRSSVWYPAGENPGQREGGFDFTYRVPKLRDWLTVYATLMSRDDVTPLFAFFPIRALVNPGVYLSRVPHLPRLDFRAEWVETNPPNAPRRNGQFAYWDYFYRDLYTNKSNLMGDWVGRVGTGFQGWSTYWFTPRTNVQVGYRHAQVASTFIPHGETLNDGSVKVNYQVGSAVTLSAFVQYENWLAPVLAPKAKNDVTTALQVTFWPRHWGVGK